MRHWTLQLAVLFVLALPGVGAAQIRGEDKAVAAAEQLLERVGGRERWATARSLHVQERVFLRSGEVAQLQIWRDFETGARRMERVTASGRFAEWLSAAGGWETRNGATIALAPEALALELQGLRQEPYAVYSRLARKDPTLRVELRGGDLYVYDHGEHLLCWFLLDGSGAPVSWGNFWNGRINQHYYGPLGDMGDANLPKWGVSTTGDFRFEYVSARLGGEAVSRPD